MQKKKSQCFFDVSPPLQFFCCQILNRELRVIFSLHCHLLLNKKEFEKGGRALQSEWSWSREVEMASWVTLRVLQRESYLLSFGGIRVSNWDYLEVVFYCPGSTIKKCLRLFPPPITWGSSNRRCSITLRGDNWCKCKSLRQCLNKALTQKGVLIIRFISRLN